MLEQINADIKVAMKAKEKEKLQALRYLKSMLMENSTSKKPTSDDDVLIKHHKKLKDSLVNFPAGHAMIAQIEQELGFLMGYLPKQLTNEEVVTIINGIKEGLDNPNMGALMKGLQPQIKGRFDGKRASELVKEALK